MTVSTPAGPGAPAARPLLTPEQIATQTSQQQPFLRLPQRAAVFGDRQLRLRQLAAGHPMRDYLLFVAELVGAQHRALQAPPAMALPDAEALKAAAEALRPPLPAAHWPRDPVWRTMLRGLLRDAAGRLAPGPAQDSVRRLADPGEVSDDWLERQADRLIHGIGVGLDLAAAPMIAAGLQAYWTQLVLATDHAMGAGAFGRTEPATTCPCCGSAPTASVTRIGADETGYRYLHCALCSAQWHYVRIKCAHCESTKGIHYESLAADESRAGTAATVAPHPGAVKAECCDECGHYLKLVAMERDAEVEPIADDLASIALDLLVSEAGHERAGLNLMLLFGDAEAEAEPPPPDTSPGSG